MRTYLIARKKGPISTLMFMIHTRSTPASHNFVLCSLGNITPRVRSAPIKLRQTNSMVYHCWHAESIRWFWNFTYLKTEYHLDVPAVDNLPMEIIQEIFAYLPFSKSINLPPYFTSKGPALSRAALFPQVDVRISQECVWEIGSYLVPSIYSKTREALIYQATCRR